MHIIKPHRGVEINWSHPLARGLVGCWLFDEGTGEKVFDLSGNNNTGTLIAMDPATDWIAGKDGFALDFDNIDDHIDCGNPSILQVTSALTMEVLISRINGQGHLLTKYNSGAGDRGYLCVVDGSSKFAMYLGFDSGGNYHTVQGETTIGDGSGWKYLVATWDKGINDGKGQLYINGVEDSYLEQVAQTTDIDAPKLGKQ